MTCDNNDDVDRDENFDKAELINKIRFSLL